MQWNLHDICVCRACGRHIIYVIKHCLLLLIATTTKTFVLGLIIDPENNMPMLDHVLRCTYTLKPNHFTLHLSFD